MATLTDVWITCRFEGFHRWKDAPDEVAFLREWHRHIFHVKLWMEVTHNNRDIEFILLKRSVEAYLNSTFAGPQNKFEQSCEQIGEAILRRFPATAVEVSEDGENGAIVRTPLNRKPK